jgi:hypothetical protein
MILAKAGGQIPGAQPHEVDQMKREEQVSNDTAKPINASFSIILLQDAFALPPSVP